MSGSRGFRALLAIALGIALAFLTLPIVAIFADTSPGRLLDSLSDPSAQDALWLSLQTTLAALLIIVVVGTPAAYLLATRTFRGRAVVLTLIELPLVLPPAAAGIGLLAALGPNGILGASLQNAGLDLVLQTSGVVVALTFVAAPFYVRQAEAAFAAVPRSVSEASRTLGAGEAATFVRVVIPSARGRTAGRGRARLGPGAGGVRRDADVRRLVSRHHPDGPACHLRPFRNRLPGCTRPLGGARRRFLCAAALRQARHGQGAADRCCALTSPPG